MVRLVKLVFAKLLHKYHINCEGTMKIYPPNMYI